MKLSRRATLALCFIFIGFCRAEDWTTNDGKTYQIIAVTKHDGVSVTVLDKEGNYTKYTTLPLADLPPDLQKRFHYDAQSAATLKAQEDVEALAVKTEAEYQQQRDALYKKAKAAFDSKEKTPVGGEVFLTTKEGETIKPGSIQIYLFSEDQARAAMTSLAEKAATATQALQPTLDDQKAKCVKLKDELDTYQGNPDGDELRVLAQAYSGELKRYRSLLGIYYHYYSQAYYVAGLPTSLAEAKTDVKGKFSISIPKTGSWVLGAYDQPETGESGGYFWLVRFGEPAMTKGGAFLSNDNLSTSDSSYSMARTMDQSTIDEIIATADGLLKRANQ